MRPEPAPSPQRASPLRVLDVLNQYGGSSERFLSRKVAELGRRGVDVTVLELRPSRRPPPLPVRVIGGGRCGQLRALIAMALSQPRLLLGVVLCAARTFGLTSRSLAATARAALLVVARPEVVHFAYSGIGVAFLDALDVLPDVRTVVSCRGSAELIRPIVDPARASKLKKLFARVDAIHCVSAAMAEHVVKLGAAPEKTHVIQPAVDVERLASVPKQRSAQPVVVSVGRLSWEKGLDDAISAMALLRDRGLDVVYRIVGGGADEDRLRFLANRFDLRGRVEFLGMQSEARVAEIVAAADVFLLPSISEGISNSVLEAMALGTPVVVTDVGGMREVVANEATGLLVEPREPRQLADAVQRILQEPEFARRLALAASDAVAERHALHQQGAAFVALYEHVLKHWCPAVVAR